MRCVLNIFSTKKIPGLKNPGVLLTIKTAKLIAWILNKFVVGSDG